MRIVLDTNVLVSGLHNPAGAPGRVVDLLLAGRIVVLYDDRILREYAEVLARPRLDIPPAQAQAVVGYIRLFGQRVAAMPLPAGTIPDPDDMPFAEVAVSGNAEALVTGNDRHFLELAGRGVSVLSPATFLESLAV